MDTGSESVLFRLKRNYLDREYIELDTIWPYRGGSFSFWLAEPDTRNGPYI